MLQYHLHIGFAPSAKPRYCHARPVLRNISQDKTDNKADERAYQYKTNLPKVSLGVCMSKTDLITSIQKLPTPL